MSPKICLNMIVKNETKVLPRLFKSLYKVIDYYVIHDTGSTDGTPEMIKEIMDNYDISGEVFHEEWVDFGINRQKALESVINSDYKADYLFWIDADEELYYDNIDWFKNLTKDAYYIKRFYGAIEFYNCHLVSIKNNNDIGWYWREPVHAYMTYKKRHVLENVDKKDVYIKSYMHEGAKSHNVTIKEKYERDVKLLTNHLKKNPNDPRTVFYLGQSYKDAGKYEEAIEWYKKRLKLKGWIQEKYYSCCKIGELLRVLKRTEEAHYYYLLSIEYDDSRYECYYYMINHYRKLNKRKVAMNLYKQLKSIDINSCKLFLDHAIHEWKMDFEVTIISYYVNEFKIAIDAFKRLFEKKSIPKNVVNQILTNFNFYIKYIDKNELNEILTKKEIFKNNYVEEQNLDKLKKQVKQEVKVELDSKISELNEDQGIKLTVTEKIN